MSMKAFLSSIFVGVLGFLVLPGIAAATSALTPGALAFYYGMPSKVNGSQTIAAAINVFSRYDAVVFGDALEFPQYTGVPGQVPYYGCDQNSHFDHDNTQSIIRRLEPLGTMVYGYVSIGGEATARQCGNPAVPTPLTMPEIKARVDAWAAMGVAGIFLDEAEYGFGCPRQRQTEIIDYIHSLRLGVFINGYNPADVFAKAVVGQVLLGNGALSSVAMNPSGLGTHLGRKDVYLLEAFQVINGNYRNAAGDAGEWTRASLASDYSDRYGTVIATVPTGRSDLPFDQGQFDYAWWSTLLHGFDFVAWGEQFYSAVDNNLPYRARPNPGRIGNAYTSSVTNPPSRPDLHERYTTCGMIAVNSFSRIGSFTASGRCK